MSVVFPLVALFALVLWISTKAASYFGRRIINKGNRNIWLLVSLALLTLAPAMLAWQLSFTSLIMFGIAESQGFSIFGIPFQAKTFQVIDGKNRRVEYLVARELPLNLGRIIGIGLLLLGSGADFTRSYDSIWG